MMGAAQNDRRSPPGEFQQGVVGIGQAMGIGDQGADIVQWHPAKFLVGSGYHQKPPIH